MKMIGARGCQQVSLQVSKRVVFHQQKEKKATYASKIGSQCFQTQRFLKMESTMTILESNGMDSVTQLLDQVLP